MSIDEYVMPAYAGTITYNRETQPLPRPFAHTNSHLFRWYVTVLGQRDGNVVTHIFFLPYLFGTPSLQF